jgi:hypothetical protein
VWFKQDASKSLASVLVTPYYIITFLITTDCMQPGFNKDLAMLYSQVDIAWYGFIFLKMMLMYAGCISTRSSNGARLKRCFPITCVERASVRQVLGEMYVTHRQCLRFVIS